MVASVQEIRISCEMAVPVRSSIQELEVNVGTINFEHRQAVSDIISIVTKDRSNDMEALSPL